MVLASDCQQAVGVPVHGHGLARAAQQSSPSSPAASAAETSATASVPSTPTVSRRSLPSSVKTATASVPRSRCAISPTSARMPSSSPVLFRYLEHLLAPVVLRVRVPPEPARQLVLVVLASQHGEQQPTELGGEDRFLREREHDQHLLSRSGHPDPARDVMRDRREVHRAEYLSRGEPRVGQVRVHGVGAAGAVEQDVRGHVIRQRDRELEDVARRQRLDIELLEDPAAGDTRLPRGGSGNASSRSAAPLPTRSRYAQARPSLITEAVGNSSSARSSKVLRDCKWKAGHAESPAERSLDAADPVLHPKIRSGRDRDVHNGSGLGCHGPDRTGCSSKRQRACCALVYGDAGLEELTESVRIEVVEETPETAYLVIPMNRTAVSDAGTRVGQRGQFPVGFALT